MGNDAPQARSDRREWSIAGEGFEALRKTDSGNARYNADGCRIKKPNIWVFIRSVD